MGFEIFRSLVSSLISAPQAPLTDKTEEIDTCLSEQEILKMAQEVEFTIDPRQFAHRLTPNYLGKTDLEGISSLNSAYHWIRLISLWLEDKAIFFKLHISKNDLKYLQETLEEYAETIKRYHNLKIEDCTAAARVTIDEVQKKILSKKLGYYIPLLYIEGVNHQGHTFPLKFIDHGAYVEAIALNLGDGAHMHPIIAWDASTPLSHFQSFPVHIEKKVLNSTKGIETFSRFILLSKKSYPAEIPGYSAEDFYGPLYQLGTVQNSYRSLPAKRAHKTQHMGVCGDMAIVLIVMDVLIDLGYEKETIQRLFCIENFTNILFFHVGLERMPAGADEECDQWQLLKNGIHEFSYNTLKASKSSLNATEAAILHNLTRHFFGQAKHQIKRLSVKTISSSPLEEEQANLKLTFVSEKKTPVSKKNPKNIPQTPSTTTKFFYKIIPPQSPQTVLNMLNLWVEAAQICINENGKIEACHYVYGAMLALPTPTCAKDFWNEVPENEIEEILEKLGMLTLLGFLPSNHRDASFLIYKNLLILSKGYCIVDKLVRRKYGNFLKGFASPFFPSKYLMKRTNGSDGTPDQILFYYKNHFFDFKLLYFGESNVQWTAIRNYFETIQGKSYATLFAFESTSINLSQGVRDLKNRKVGEEWSGVKQHLKFLESFLTIVYPEKTNSNLALEEKFAELWINQNKELPREFEVFYFFAHYTWYAFQYYDLEIGKVEIPYRKRIVNTKIYIESSTLRQHISERNQERWLGLRGSTPWKDKKLSENQIQCIESKSSHWNTKTYREWCRIFSTPSLQITSLMQWMRRNPALLSQEDLRLSIERALFAPNLLHVQQYFEPSTIFQLRILIEELLNYYAKTTNDLSTILFFIRVGVCIETYVPPSKRSLKFYESQLLNSLKKYSAHQTLIHVHLLFFYQVGLPNHESSLRHLIKSHFWCKYHDMAEIQLSLPWLVMEISTPLQSYLLEIDTILANKKASEEIFDEIFCLIFPEEALPAGEFHDENPIFRKGEYSINIIRGQIHKGSKTFVHLENSMLASFPIFSNASCFWKDKEELYSVDNLFRLETLPTGGFSVSKRFPQCEENGFEWFHLAENDSNLFQGSLLAGKKFDHWILGYKVLICPKRRSQPLYVAYNMDGVWRLYKLQPDGKPGLSLVNLSEETSELASWMRRLGDITEVCVWYNEKTRLIDEIDFLDLGISFQGEFQKGQRRFKCTNFPELFIAQEQAVPTLNHFAGCLVLENERGKSVLIPNRKFQRNDQNFSSTVSLKNEFFPNERYFLYQLDEISGQLIHSEPEANFFLSFLFAQIRDYTKAAYYLSLSKTFSFFVKQFHLFDCFKDLKDTSPEALSFFLRLGLHVIGYEEQLAASSFGSENRLGFKKYDTPSQVFEWMAGILEKYLRVRSAKEFSRVPAHIRLTIEEEIFLLDYLKPKLSGKDKDIRDQLVKQMPFYFRNGVFEPFVKANLPTPLWLSSFDVHRHLIGSGAISLTVHPTKYTLFRSDAVHSDQLDDNFFYQQAPSFSKETGGGFVRLSELELRMRFISFYEKAKLGELDLDLFYLQRSGSEGSKVIRAYIYLLRYVQNYPAEFKDLDFTNDPNRNREVFEQIAAKATRRMANFYETCSSVMKAYSSIYFAYQSTSNFSMAPAPIFLPIEWTFPADKTHYFKHLQKELFSLFKDKYFDEMPVPFIDPKIPFPLDVSNQKNITVSSSMLIDQLLKSYRELSDPKNGKKVYSLKEGKNHAAILEEARQILKEKKSQSERIKTDAENKANEYPEVSWRLGFRKISRDLPEITMEDILTKAYLGKNPMLIKHANPSLSSATIYELMFLTIEYHLVRIQVFQLQKAIQHLEKNGDIQNFARSICSYGEFDAAEEPELIVYQSRSGKILRESQAALFSWELETTKTLVSKRLFAIKAGDGKTTLYQPVVIKRLKRMYPDMIPFSFSSEPLYEADREGLRATSSRIFSFDIDICELALNSKTEASDFKRIFESLETGRDKKDFKREKGFKLIPKTFYALFLKYQLALEERDVETVRWISKIFHLFSTSGIALVDECRINCSPFTQAKIGGGKKRRIPAIDRKVVLEIYRALTSSTIFIKDGRSVANVVCLESNFQATMTENDHLQVKESVLKELVQNPLFNIPKDERDSVYAYWMNIADEPLNCKTQSDPDQTRAILMVKVYFEKFYKTSTKLVWMMNHVRSINGSEEIYIPAVNRQASAAYFEKVYVTLFATIQGFLQEGFHFYQAINLFCKLLEIHAREANVSQKVSNVEEMIHNWTGKKDFRFHQFSTSNYEQMSEFFSLVSKNREALFWYLENVILKQIFFSQWQLTVSPVYFRNAFRSIIFFSAEPGTQEIYGISGETPNVRQDTRFLARALHEFSLQENSQLLIFPHFSSPKEFFNILYMKDKTIFNDLRMIVDAGGMLRFKMQDILDAFLVFVKSGKADYDGLIFFQESSTSESTQLLVCLKGSDRFEVLKGHDVPSALASLGLNWEKLKLLCFIGPTHRAGSNIEHVKGSSILVLSGEDLAFSDNVQGALRGRGVLEKEQKIIWGISEKVAQSICDPSTLSPPKMFSWEVQNEGEIRDKEALLNAYQEIDYLVAEKVLDQLKENYADPFEQIEIWHRHHSGFVTKVEQDPIKESNNQRKFEKIEDELLDYAKKVYEPFGYKIPFEKNTRVIEKLNDVIAHVKKMGISASSNQLDDTARHTFMHHYQQEEVKKHQAVIHETQDLTAEPIKPLPEWLTLDRSDFPYKFASLCTSARSLFGSKYLTEGLYFSHNAIYTAKREGESLKERYVKPIQYVLIVSDKKKYWAFACADAEAVTFQNGLRKLTSSSFYYTLLGWDGSLTQRAVNGFSLEGAELNNFFVRDALIDVGLSRCELLDVTRFQERIKDWIDFWPMWEKMKNGQPLAQDIRPQTVEMHIPPSLSKNPVLPSKGILSMLNFN